MKRLNSEQLIAAGALTGIILLFGSFLFGSIAYVAMLMLTAGVMLAVFLCRQIGTPFMLRKTMALLLCAVVVGNIVIPAYASGIVPGYAEKGNGRDLLTYLRDELAVCVETYQLTPGMTDSDLANVYFSLNSQQSKYAWDNGNQLKKDASNLNEEDANLLSADENTQLCLRFYDIMQQINTPTLLAASKGPFEPCDYITVSVEGNLTSDAMSADKIITVSAKSAAESSGCGTTYTQETVTVTIQNTRDTNAEVSFKWSIENAVNQSIAGNTAASGTYKEVVDGKSEITIEFTTAENDTTAKLTLSEFKNTEAAETSNVTIQYDSTLGSVTAGGEAVDSEDTVEGVSLETGIALVATPKEGVTFLGWIDATDNNRRLSADASYTYQPSADATVQAVFVTTASDDAWFLVNNTYLTDDLKEAGTLGTNIVLMNNGTLAAGDYTIASGDTLLIPYDSAHTLCTTKPTIDGSTGFLSASANKHVQPSAYRTLYMADGAQITVGGAMSLSGKMCIDQRHNGFPSGPLGFVDMAEGSSITVSNGGNLYAWGYITGAGSVTVKSGGTVYENFQVRDWRGGTAASGMLGKTQKVFPVSQYYVQNVEVPMTLEAGAKEYGYMGLVASKAFGDTTVPFIGGTGMFQNSGTIVKDYNESTDRLEIQVNGNLAMSSLNLEVSAYKMNSAEYVLPITNNLTVKVNSGTTTISQDMCMLPGSEIVIGEVATVALAEGVSLYVYDFDEWDGKKFVYTNCDVSPLPYVGCKNGEPVGRSLTDANINVIGKLDASLGFLYTTGGTTTAEDGTETTTGGANIYSTGSGQVITGAAGTATITYQATQSGTTITFVKVPITPAQLKNSNESCYTSTAETDAGGYGAGPYTYINDIWHRGEACSGGTATCTEAQVCTFCQEVLADALGHSYEAAVTAPTCTEAGYTTYTCSLCKDTYTGDEVGATGHSFGAWYITKEPTCTESGTKQRGCENCTEVQTATVAAGHTPSVAWSFDETGHWHICEDCGEVIDQQAHIAGDAATANTAQTCTICGYILNEATGEILPKLSGTSIRIGDCLNICFYISGLEGDDYTAFISREKYENGELTTLTQEIPASQWDTSGSYRCFTYKGIAAKEMTDTVTVVIKDANGVQVMQEATESIRGYAMRALEKQVNGKALWTALVDMLNYGAAAQTYFGYRTEDLANSLLTAGETGYATAEDVSIVNRTQKRITGSYPLAGAVITVKSDLHMTIYHSGITADDLASMYAKASYADHYGNAVTQTIPGTDFLSTTSGSTVLYGPKITGLAVADGRTLVTCEIYKDDELQEKTVSSIESYAAASIGQNSGTDGNAAQVTVCKMLMKFVDSAYAYFHG